MQAHHAMEQIKNGNYMALDKVASCLGIVYRVHNREKNKKVDNDKPNLELEYDRLILENTFRCRDVNDLLDNIHSDKIKLKQSVSILTKVKQRDFPEMMTMTERMAAWQSDRKNKPYTGR